MHHLFIARHGSYDDDRINSYGRKQMEMLGNAIKQILNGDSIHLLSSTAPRALDSSEVLASQLALASEFERDVYLWSGTDAPKGTYYSDRNKDKLMQLVNERREKADALLMMTHLEVAESFPSYFLQKEFGQDRCVGDLSKGRAVHIDLELKTYELIPKIV